MSERQDKRAQFQESKKRGLLPWIIVALVVIAAGAGIVGWKSIGTAAASKYPLVRAEAGQVVLPADRLADGRAHFFTYRGSSADIDFFVLKSSDGVIRAAFDTCDVCYRERKGYRQEGDVMVCNNCDQKFKSELINEVKGGCNPAPLARTAADGRVVIAAAELERGAWYFEKQPK